MTKHSLWLQYNFKPEKNVQLLWYYSRNTFKIISDAAMIRKYCWFLLKEDCTHHKYQGSSLLSKKWKIVNWSWEPRLSNQGYYRQEKCKGWPTRIGWILQEYNMWDYLGKIEKRKLHVVYAGRNRDMKTKNDKIILNKYRM